ncbi:MAG: hypothetical protein H6822_17010 [Planctomycetaceae bacterium]|nr:hypothetical protein [Planctomycetales bacterium]MCB9923885.1 hypothetical protein [Planctomycetaceae bacterium]
MGSVNRCWRCGKTFVAQRSESGLPPIRRLPPKELGAGVLIAELADDPTTTSDTELSPATSAVITRTSSVRRGSPFGDRGTAVIENIGSECAHEPACDRDSKHRQTSGGAACALLSLPIGVISFVTAFLLPIAGILLAVFGIGVSICGLNSRRRRSAIAGLLFCCLSLATSMVTESIDLYIDQNGIAPWKSNQNLP